MFDTKTLTTALQELGARAEADGRIVEISIYGGAAMLLTFDNRSATKDVDSVFEKDKEWIRKQSADIAEKFNWDENWINDGVKGFLSRADSNETSKQLHGQYPKESDSGLVRVFKASPEYLFAMKSIAMRIDDPDNPHDIEDINYLIEEIGLENSDQALDLVRKFYPDNKIQAKTQFGLEEIFEKRAKKDTP